jgi:hypothetical protein
MDLAVYLPMPGSKSNSSSNAGMLPLYFFATIFAEWHNLSALTGWERKWAGSSL